MSGGFDFIESQNKSARQPGKVENEAVNLLDEPFVRAPDKQSGPKETLDTLDIQVSQGGKVTNKIRESYKKLIETNEGKEQNDTQKKFAQAARVRLAQNLAATGDFADATKELASSIKRYPELAQNEQLLKTASLCQSIHNKQFLAQFKAAGGDEKNRAIQLSPEQLLSQDEQRRVKIEADKLSGLFGEKRIPVVKEMINNAESKRPQSHETRCLASIGRLELASEFANQGQGQKAIEQLRILVKQYPESVNWTSMLSVAGHQKAYRDKEFLDAYLETGASLPSIKHFADENSR